MNPRTPRSQVHGSETSETAASSGLGASGVLLLARISYPVISTRGHREGNRGSSPRIGRALDGWRTKEPEEAQNQ